VAPPPQAPAPTVASTGPAFTEPPTDPPEGPTDAPTPAEPTPGTPTPVEIVPSPDPVLPPEPEPPELGPPEAAVEPPDSRVGNATAPPPLPGVVSGAAPAPGGAALRSVGTLRAAVGTLRTPEPAAAGAMLTGPVAATLSTARVPDACGKTTVGALLRVAARPIPPTSDPRADVAVGVAATSPARTTSGARGTSTSWRAASEPPGMSAATPSRTSDGSGSHPNPEQTAARGARHAPVNTQGRELANDRRTPPRRRGEWANSATGDTIAPPVFA
jgi:hypothetical protein